MVMTKEQSEKARRAYGQFDYAHGADIVGRSLKGTCDYFGVENEFKLTTDATAIEILAPGFFDMLVKSNKSYLGALIRCVCKHKSVDPADWSFGKVVILKVRGMPITDAKGNQVLSAEGRPTFHATSVVGLLERFKKPAISDDRVHDAPSTEDVPAEGGKRRKLG